MSQHDLSIADQSAPAFRADLNNALAALGSLQSGATEPALPYSSLLWYDTSVDTLKIGNEAGDAWYSVGYVDNSAGSFNVIDGTTVSTTAGVVVGSLAAQTQTVWNTGVATTETLISPAKLKAAIATNTPASGWQFVEVMWEFDVDGGSGLFESSDLEDGYDYRLIILDVEGRVASGSGWRVGVQNATSSTWYYDDFAGPANGVLSVAMCRESSLVKPSSDSTKSWSIGTAAKIKRFGVRDSATGAMASGKIILQKIATSYSA
jgi:hypothetical protein